MIVMDNKRIAISRCAVCLILENFCALSHKIIFNNKPMQHNPLRIKIMPNRELGKVSPSFLIKSNGIVPQTI